MRLRGLDRVIYYDNRRDVFNQDDIPKDDYELYINSNMNLSINGDLNFDTIESLEGAINTDSLVIYNILERNGIEEDKMRVSSYVSGFVSSRAEYLDLSGWDLHTIPHSINYLYGLRELLLNNNHIEKLPSTWDGLINLEKLDLSNNQIYEIPQGISDLLNLRQLFLQNNSIENVSLDPLKLKELWWLNIGGNPLKDNIDRLFQFENLQSLFMYNCLLDSLPDCMHGSMIKNLYLSNNNLTTLPESITHMPLLMNLDLQNNKLMSLPGSIELLKNLGDLNVVNNNLQTLPPTIISMQNLHCIHVNSNKLTNCSQEVINWLNQHAENNWKENQR